MRNEPMRPQQRTSFKARRLILLTLLLAILGIVANEILVAIAATDVAADVATRDLEQIGDAWAQYDELSRRSYLLMGTASLKQSLTERTSALANRVFANYRTPSPTVRETQWQLARDALARALVATGGTEQLRAALRYCEGHLHRINGEAKKAERETDDSQRELTEAVLAFREAVELRPEWPDPFLGLARTFIYGLEDVDRGADALKQAQRHGHTPNERETAQLADGYRTRGNTFVRIARQLAGLPQEREYLTRAAEAYRQALALYATASSFANVPANIGLAQRALNQVENRLAVLSQSPPDPGAAVKPDVSSATVPFQSSIFVQEAIPWA